MGKPLGDRSAAIAERARARDAGLLAIGLGRQFLTFGVVGLAATVVHVSLALTLNARFAVGPIIANFAGYSCGFFVSYLGNSLLTFRRPALHGQRLSRFLAASLGGLALNQAIVFPLVTLAHLPLKLALAPAVVIVPIVSFAAARLWVFSGKDEDARTGRP